MLSSSPSLLALLFATPSVALNVGPARWDRRSCIAAAATASTSFLAPPLPAAAFVAGSDDETSGLVVLRVAEVCNFQEKLLRTIAKCAQPNAKDLKDQFGLPYCGGEAYYISPVQILFGTGLLLKNSNLDGNLRLMIETEVPRKQRDAAITDAVAIMNTFNRLVEVSKEYTTFEPNDMIIVADIYEDARKKLNDFFDYLPEASKQRFYNYADDVRKYEEKVSSDGGIERMKL